jgi:AcrR family transcriptional regulator
MTRVGEKKGTSKAAGKAKAVKAGKVQSEAEIKPNGKTARSVKTRKRLVEATIKLVAEVGVDAVSVSEVARRAGVTRPGAYYHFKSREELMAAVADELDEQLLKIVEGSMDVEDVYSFPADIAAEDQDLIRLRILKMLEHGSVADVLITQRKKVFRANARKGRLQAGVDPEIAAIIASTSLVAAYLAVSEGKTKSQRHQLAKRFGKTYHHMLFYGVLDPKSTAWPDVPDYPELDVKD